ncbi:brother of CDO [Acipenser ruthenus]|uniref:brother of CDO n=1 Tax=Acipenser ruthenus TaxID=7906 RepID=UPI0027429948|nr:brother of CDO [Acipenser ruthenus]
MMKDMFLMDGSRMGLWKNLSFVAWLLVTALGFLVSAADELPTFTVQPMSAVQKLGGPVTLRCRVEPPTANVSWRLNGHELRDSNASLEVLIQPEALIIPALSNLTIGRYQCIARTAIGASASVSATVTAAKLRDFEADDQHEIEVDEGNTAVIECHLPESHPKAQVRYSVKQEWLETSKGNYLIMPSGNLQIVNATQEDEGTYKCAAYNPVTQEVKTSSSSDRLRIRRSTSEAARIIYPLGAQSIIVTKGQSLVLECVASGIPPPQVTWSKDGAGLHQQNKTRFLLSNLLIDATSEADSGTYSCQADNGVGEIGAAYIFYSVQVLEPPEVSLELQQQFVPWGQNARFSCSIRGNPLPSVVWLRNAAPLSQSQRHRLTKRVLRVLNVGPQDDGIYQCMAENEVGSSQGAARLITVPAEKLPTQIIKPVNPDKILRDKASQKPRPTLPVVPIKCPVDAGKVSPAEAPIILSLPRTTKSDSYELLWKPRDGGSPVLEYIVRHRKATDSTDDWTVTSIPGNLHRLTLVKLDPSSLYEVEMATKNCAGLGQAAMMTFRTGRSSGPEKILNDDPCSSSQNPSPSDNACLSPPEAPDRPTISMANETSVYVTWIPRGNRGFPIQSFCVEYKKLKGGDWTRATSNIPPSRLSVQISQLEKGDSYKFRVRAVNILGESRPSTPSKPYVVSSSHRVAVAGPIAGPHITYTEAINETTIMLKWMYTSSFNNNTPIHGFYIYYRPTDSDNDGDYKKDVVEGDRHWHSIVHLMPETSYDIKMKCFNEGGESKYSNVMICETKARRYPRTTARPVSRHPNAGHREVPAVARSSDLPYLIVGVVLGAIVFIIVAFIPFCLWRAWAKQKQTSDLAFPAASLPVSSCQYTMVPLQGLAVPNGHCAADRATIALNGGHHPLSRNDYTTSGKHLNYCLGGLHQGEMECNSLLQENMMCNGRPAAYRYSERLPEHDHEENSFLPDDSTHQLLNTGNHQASSVCHVTGSEAPCCRIEGAREINMNGGPPPCVAVLTPVEVESPETLRSLSNCSTQQPQDSPGPEVTQEEVIFSPNTTKEQSGQLQSNDKE